LNPEKPPGDTGDSWRYALMVGGFNPFENYYCSQLERLFPIYGKLRNVPKHQPD